MVIAVTGVIAGMMAVFIRAPVQGYLDAARRARMTDTADTALRRITRELRHALPNSVRLTNAGGRFYLEFLLTSGGGRYRAEPTAAATGDVLSFALADASFDTIGPPPAFAPGRWVVLTNLGPGSGADAYAGDNRSAWTGLAGNTLSIAPFLFPVASPGQRFQIVETPVTYECDPTPGQNVLRRHWGYAIAAAQGTPPAGGAGGILASGVGDCLFTYESSGGATRTGIVSLRLELTEEGETVVLFQQAHVSNAP